MQPSFHHENRQRQDSLASTRLQKAIERNRKKQMKKTVREEQKPNVAEQAMFNFSEKNQYIQEEHNNDRLESYFAKRKELAGVRRSVARPDNVQFTRGKSRGGGDGFSGGPKYTKKSSRASAKKWNLFAHKSLLAKAGWGFCFFLLLRLFFADNGLMHYYNKDKMISHKKTQLKETKKSIVNLNKEIKLLRISRSYQKKMARKHLGVIAKNEFLVLFASEKNQ